MRKTTWPTWPELVRMTGIVITTVVLFALLIGAADLGLGTAVKPLYIHASPTAGRTPIPASKAPVVASPSGGASPSPSAPSTASTASPAATPTPAR
jgi:preprotein translocase SecE subunit